MMRWSGNWQNEVADAMILKEGAQLMANLNWLQCPAVESIPGKVSGAWVLRGTRMPVSAIFENIEAGANTSGWHDRMARQDGTTGPRMWQDWGHEASVFGDSMA
jgi:hypothetical protein